MEVGFRKSSVFIFLLVLCFSTVCFASGQIKVSASVPSAKLYSLHDFKRANFKKGAYYLQGYVVKVYTCPVCPNGAQCKPCMGDNIVISEYNRILSDYTYLGKSEVIIFVNNPRVFKLGRKYKFLVNVSDSKSTLEEINDLELVSYSVLK